MIRMNLNQSENSFIHIPVLSQELITGLNLQPGGHYLDATVGGGGHSMLILAADPTIQLTAIDRDERAIISAQKRLSIDYADRIEFWHGNFADYPGEPSRFDGIIADLGVSSPQLDIPERGFSFQQEAALDMRMDQTQELTAEEIVNHWDEKELADIIYQYGEERLSRRIARQIVEKRPFQTTTELANEIFHSVPRKYRYGRIHPATRTFQGLRIAVNKELTSIEEFIERSPTWLKPEGRIGMISFHSLEDRIVKHHFRNHPQLKVITKKPITAQPEEEKQNRRARSAKLRFASKV